MREPEGVPQPVPRGIEILLQKAAVDPAFRERLLAGRDGAAREIGLELEPAEEALLRDIAPAHLVTLIEKTRVAAEVGAALAGDSMDEIGPALEETDWWANAPRPSREIRVGGIRPGLLGLIRRILGG